MKNLKMSKIIQIILLTLLLVVIGIIAVGVFSDNNVMATLEKCPKCNKGVLIVTNCTDEGHSWICNNEDCGYKYGVEEHTYKCVSAEGIEGETKHKYVKKCAECYYQKKGEEWCTDLLEQFSDIGNERHKAMCSECKTWYELKHVYDKDGICKSCGAKAKIYDDGPCPKCDEGTLIAYEPDENGHSWKCNNKECNYTYGVEEHIYEYIKAEDIGENGKHKYLKICTKCGFEKTGEEWCTDLLEQFSDLGNGKHKAICSACKTWYELPHQKDKDGNCKLCEYEEKQDENLKIDITSDKYKITDKYISEIQSGTTLSQMKANMETNATDVKIYNKDNELVSSSVKVATGMKVQLKLGDTTKELAIVVNGDVDGDGDIKLSDMVVVNKNRLNKKKLEGTYALAADVTGDEKIDFKDLTKINKFRLNKITEL